jgi:hypothetical protein
VLVNVSDTEWKAELTKMISAPTARERRTSMSSELWLGYVAGALTFGWLLPWIGRKIK